MHSFRLRAVLAAVLTACTTCAVAQAQTSSPRTVPQTSFQNIKLNTSFVYTRGSYGLPTDTDIWLVLVNPEFENESWRVQVSIPYIHLKGPASVVGNAGTAAASRSEQGLGDASLTVTRKFGDVWEGWHPSFAAKVKFPTGDQAKGLGTGETDAAFEADVFRSAGNVTPYGTLGYQIYGHSTAYPLKSGFYASVGVATKLAPEWTGGVGGNWRESIIAGQPQAVEMMAFVQRNLTGDSHLLLFVLHGFTDASPDIALGATLGLSF